MKCMAPLMSTGVTSMGAMITGCPAGVGGARQDIYTHQNIHIYLTTFTSQPAHKRSQLPSSHRRDKARVTPTSCLVLATEK
eukprot:m.36905 g.36905  ORF g.36905 m.36905 type:complete len:81 (+) comp44862_c0_seq1:166-408(+)